MAKGGSKVGCSVVALGYIISFFKSQFTLLIGAVLIIVITVVSTSINTTAAPFPECKSQGILFQYPGVAPTSVHEIDMVTGIDQEPAGTPIPNRQINAIGYNVQDNYIYGWDNQTGQMVQIQDDWSATPIGAPNGYAGGTTNVYVGDVDSNGDYWFTSGTRWYQVDLTAGPTYKNILATGPINPPANSGTLGDWAFIPGRPDLYTTMNDTTLNQARLWVFNTTTHTWSSPGLLPAITPYQPLVEGAMYTDSEGYLYASVNLTGDIWRIDVASVTAALLSSGDPSTNNDGARCANAPLAIDFGDAPFLTMLADAGPRHELIGYNDTTHTASLMLGETVDDEPDGFASVNADGDDRNNIDDEDAIPHIVAPLNTPTALSVPITVTNNNSTDATLAGWIDFNGNNTFEASERVIQTIPSNTGVAQYELDFPSATFTAATYSRFRVFSGVVADPQPTGGATAGEVEDHLVQVGSYTIKKTSSPESGTEMSPGEIVTYTLTITNTGLTDLISLTLHDDLTGVLDDATIQDDPVVDPSSAGTTTIDDESLEFKFTDDILAGQSVKITYAVKVKPANELDNKVLQNIVIGAYSNCHSAINDQVVSVADPDCSTEHSINVDNSLANTGQNMQLIFLLSGGLIGTSLILGLYMTRRTLLQY